MSAREPDGTYPTPRHGWTCFHCGETFSIGKKYNCHQAALEAAQDHFGKYPDADPACILKLEGGDLGLLRELRQAQTDLERYRQEDTDLHRQIHAMAAEHHVALIREEEKGYARGLKDGMAMSQSELEKVT